MGALFLFLTVVYLMAISINLTEQSLFANAIQNGNLTLVFDAISSGFLNTYVVAFELVSILLFTIVIGVSEDAK